MNLVSQISTMAPNMNSYLLTVLVKNDLKEDSRSNLLETIKKNLGQLDREDLWGSRDLAYPIKQQKKAYYAHFLFQSDPSKIPSLDKMVKLNEDIIRYLLVKVDPKKIAQKTADKKENKES